MLQDRLELVRRDREIKKPVPARAAVLVDLLKPLGEIFESGFVTEIAFVIKKRLPEVLPNFIAHHLARELPDGVFHFLPKIVVAFLAPGETDHSQSRRQL